MVEILDGTSDETAIRKLIQDWAGSVRGGDIEGILRHHASDMLLFDVPPPFQSKGIDAYRKSWDLFYSWAHKPVVFDIREMNIVAGSDVAFVTASMRCSGKEANGTDIALDFRLTAGLRQIDGRWIIVHEHHSIPATD